ncbi:MAG: serine hydrolase domain-containing protein [Pseudomonadota bacterium]
MKIHTILLLIACWPVLCSAQANWRTEFQSVTPTNFDAGGAVSHQFHLNAESYLTTATVTAPSEAHPLDTALKPELAQLMVHHRNGEDAFSAYVATEPWLSSAIVLHQGQIVFEAYPRMRVDQRHLAWSVSKAITAGVIAALVHDGLVELNRPVSSYVPALADSAWADLRVRDVLDMASGIDCLDSDGYQNPTACIYRMEETMGITADQGYPATLIEHMANMSSHRTAGEQFEYVSANTNVLGLIAEDATDLPFATVLSDQIWRPMGGETDALVIINEDGYSYASGGVIVRLRDLARFGQLFIDPTRYDVFSKDLVEAMQRQDGVPFSAERQAQLAKWFEDDAPVRAGWQWDMIWDDGAMFKGGYLGQGLYVDPDRDLVIAWFGTGEDYSAKQNEMLMIARQIVRSDWLN